MRQVILRAGGNFDLHGHILTWAWSNVRSGPTRTVADRPGENMLKITKFAGALACAVAVMNLAPAIGDETSTRIGPL
jgi:hypothetical protein